MLDGETSSNWSSTRQNGPVSPSCKSIQRKPARCVSLVGRMVSIKTSAYAHTCAFTVVWCSTATITPHSTFLTEGSDGAHAKLSLRVRSVRLLREAPGKCYGESSRCFGNKSGRAQMNQSALFAQGFASLTNRATMKNKQV